MSEADNIARRLSECADAIDMGRKPDPKSIHRRAAAELRRLDAAEKGLTDRVHQQAGQLAELGLEQQRLHGRLGFIAQEIAYAEIHGWPRESQKRLTDMVDAFLKAQRDKATA